MTSATPETARGTTPVIGDPAWLAPTYFVLYLGYLFATLEGEFGHLLTMVLIPVAIAVIFAGPGTGRLGRGLASLGVAPRRMGRGLFLALGLCVAVGLFQIVASRQGDEIVALLTSSRALVVLPLVMAFLLFTTALTEEVFFRGYLQTRLERLTGSRFAGLLLASVLFGVYHLPYAYLNPMWPSSGDWGAAFSAALGQGIPGGLILGGLFIYARGNLVAPILVHAAVDLLPASTMIKIQGL